MICLTLVAVIIMVMKQLMPVSVTAAIVVAEGAFAHSTAVGAEKLTPNRWVLFYS